MLTLRTERTQPDSFIQFLHFTSSGTVFTYFDMLKTVFHCVSLCFHPFHPFHPFRISIPSAPRYAAAPAGISLGWRSAAEDAPGSSSPWGGSDSVSFGRNSTAPGPGPPAILGDGWRWGIDDLS